jgi:Ca-activated chloride channel family protein
VRFLVPWIGGWIAIGVAVLALLKWRVRRRYAATTMVRVLGASRYRASIVRRAPFLLLAATLALTALALMQPVIPYSQADVQSRGLDIAVVLDLSSSMQEEMGSAQLAANRSAASGVRPGRTRLDAVKQAIRTFVSGRRDDRIGLIVFSDNAYVVSPLTFDHDYLLHYIDMVDDQLLRGEGQTAIGDGLALADYLLFRQATKDSTGHQVVVLFTDGENNRGREPVEVLEEARQAQIRVHMVGVDLEQEVREKPTVQALIRTIERNGGRYFNATSERALADASRTIDAIEKGHLVNRVYVRDVPVYQWFAVPALVMLCAAMGLKAVPYFVDQT